MFKKANRAYSEIQYPSPFTETVLPLILIFHEVTTVYLNTTVLHVCNNIFIRILLST